MTMILAAVLLYSGAEPAPEWHPVLAPAVQRLAVDMQLMDPRETRFLMVNPGDFAGDVYLIHNRHKEIGNAPFVEEAERFPPRELVNDFISFNRSYRHDLLERLAIDAIHGGDINAALAETEQLYRIWDAVRDARCDYYYVVVRRQSLLTLRELVGPEAFYSGRLPPHVPVWRFEER